MEFQQFAIVIAGLLIITLGFMVVPASGAMLTISPGDSIQSAVNHADPGDTIILNPGMYNQHGIVVNKDITIRANTSAGGSRKDTMIDGNLSDRIFNITSGITFILDNLTLQNASTTGSGGAIEATGAAIIINSSTFSNCSAESGGAIFARLSTGTITSSAFSDCVAKRYASEGGAISFLDGTLMIQSSIFSRCSAIPVSKSPDGSIPLHSSGGAIYSYNSTIIITSSSFSSCSSEFGGALYPRLTAVTITSSQFFGCSATHGGGAVFSPPDSPRQPFTITSSEFTSCSAVTGGAVSASDILNITSSGFSSCSAVSDGHMISHGGAIYSESGPLNVASSTFSNCSSDWYGSAIHSSSGRGSIHFSRFSGNNGRAITTDHKNLDATNNWWGTNDNPSVYTSGEMRLSPWYPQDYIPKGNVTVSPWLVLSITATPLSGSHAQSYTIRANLTKNSDGIDTAGDGTFVPDGIASRFSVSSGNGSVMPQNVGMVNGMSEATFRPATTGNSTLSATVDDQSLQEMIITDSLPETVPGFGFIGTLCALFVCWILRFRS
jgi:hypothetical protein